MYKNKMYKRRESHAKKPGFPFFFVADITVKSEDETPTDEFVL